MLYVKIPKDLREYKRKVFAGRTAQELFWIVLALVVGGSVFAVTYVTIGTDIGSYITMAVGFPIFILGFVQIQDMSTLEFLKKVIKFYKVKQFVTYHNDMLVESTRKEKTSKEAKIFKKEMRKIRENS